MIVASYATMASPPENRIDPYVFPMLVFGSDGITWFSRKRASVCSVFEYQPWHLYMCGLEALVAGPVVRSTFFLFEAIGLASGGLGIEAWVPVGRCASATTAPPAMPLLCGSVGEAH